MRPSLLLAAAVLAQTAPAAAAPGSVQDFRLPPQEGRAPSDLQGPVDEQGQPPQPAPTPSAPTPQPSVAVPPPDQVVTPAEIPPSTVPQATSPRVAQSPVAPAAETPSDDAVAQPSIEASQPAPLPDASPMSSPSPTREAAVETAPAGLGWLWWLAVALAGVLAILGGRTLLRRKRRAPPQVQRPAPPVERPTPAPPPARPGFAATAEELVTLELEPLRLSLTLMNATLSYRLAIVNRGQETISALEIEADMISAHASLPREQQLAGPDHATAGKHLIGPLAPGERAVVQGDYRLPLTQIVPIRQGSATLLLPLARFRARPGNGAHGIVRTFIVGQPGTAGLQPFRLDQGPRVFSQLAQRAFAEAAA